YTYDELVQFTKKLIKKSNTLQYRLAGNDTVKVKFSFPQEELKKLAVQGYEEIAKTQPNFAYTQKSIKPSLFSLPLTYMGFSGYLNPLTNEAQINDRLPQLSLPTVTT